MATMHGQMPDVGKIIEYENGEMGEEEMIEFFQELIDSGYAWRLQGHYGRTAAALIEAGLCHRAGEGENDDDGN
jgi:hypothetical protein